MKMKYYGMVFILEECSKYTLNSVLKEKIIELSKGNLPQGWIHDKKNNRLVIKKDGIQTIIPLNDSASEIFKKIAPLLIEPTKKGCMEYKNFKDIRHKHIKDYLIMGYALKLKEKYNLTNREFSKLTSTIQIGFQFKSLSVNDVEYDNEIVNIKNLVFDKDTRSFKIPDIKQASKVEKNQTTDKFYSALKKYLKEDNVRQNMYEINT